MKDLLVYRLNHFLCYSQHLHAICREICKEAAKIGLLNCSHSQGRHKSFPKLPKEKGYSVHSRAGHLLSGSGVIIYLRGSVKK